MPARKAVTDPRVCTKCKEAKPLTSFGIEKRSSGGYKSHCKDCCAKYSYELYRTNEIVREKHKTQSNIWYRDNYEAALASACRKRASKKSLPCTITAADIPVPENCPVCACSLTRASTYGGTMSSPSVDMYDPVLGYVPGNVWVICKGCNGRKSDMTGDDHIAFGWKLINAFKEHCDRMA